MEHHCKPIPRGAFQVKCEPDDVLAYGNGCPRKEESFHASEVSGHNFDSVHAKTESIDVSVKQEEQFYHVNKDDHKFGIPNTAAMNAFKTEAKFDSENKQHSSSSWNCQMAGCSHVQTDLLHPDLVARSTPFPVLLCKVYHPEPETSVPAASGSSPPVLSSIFPPVLPRISPLLPSISPPLLPNISPPAVPHLSKCTMLSSSQPLRQSAAQPVVRSASQPMQQTTSQPVALSASQPVHQTTSQPVALSASQPVQQTASQPIVLSASQPIVLSASQPVQQTASQPIVLSASQPIVLSASQPVLPNSSSQSFMLNASQPVLPNRSQPILWSGSQPNMLSASHNTLPCISESILLNAYQPFQPSACLSVLPNFSQPILPTANWIQQQVMTFNLGDTIVPLSTCRPTFVGNIQTGVETSPQTLAGCLASGVEQQQQFLNDDDNNTSKRAFLQRHADAMVAASSKLKKVKIKGGLDLDTVCSYSCKHIHPSSMVTRSGRSLASQQDQNLNTGTTVRNLLQEKRQHSSSANFPHALNSQTSIPPKLAKIDILPESKHPAHNVTGSESSFVKKDRKSTKCKPKNIYILGGHPRDDTSLNNNKPVISVKQEKLAIFHDVEDAPVYLYKYNLSMPNRNKKADESLAQQPPPVVTSQSNSNQIAPKISCKPTDSKIIHVADDDVLRLAPGMSFMPNALRIQQQTSTLGEVETSVKVQMPPHIIPTEFHLKSYGETSSPAVSGSTLSSLVDYGQLDRFVRASSRLRGSIARALDIPGFPKQGVHVIVEPPGSQATSETHSDESDVRIDEGLGIDSVLSLCSAVSLSDQEIKKGTQAVSEEQNKDPPPIDYEHLKSILKTLGDAPPSHRVAGCPRPKRDEPVTSEDDRKLIQTSNKSCQTGILASDDLQPVEIETKLVRVANFPLLTNISCQTVRNWNNNLELADIKFKAKLGRPRDVTMTTLPNIPGNSSGMICQAVIGSNTDLEPVEAIIETEQDGDASLSDYVEYSFCSFKCETTPASKMVSGRGRRRQQRHWVKRKRRRPTSSPYRHSVKKGSGIVVCYPKFNISSNRNVAEAIRDTNIPLASNKCSNIREETGVQVFPGENSKEAENIRTHPTSFVKRMKPDTRRKLPQDRQHSAPDIIQMGNRTDSDDVGIVRPLSLTRNDDLNLSLNGLEFCQQDHLKVLRSHLPDYPYHASCQ